MRKIWRSGGSRRDPNAPAWTLERLFEIFPNLRELRSRLAGDMSGGEQQMLTIARTLMGNPSLLLLDEPSEGLAPRIVEQMIEAIHEMKREGLSLFVSEQNLAFARLVADRVYVIEKGAYALREPWRNSTPGPTFATPISRFEMNSRCPCDTRMAQ